MERVRVCGGGALSQLAELPAIAAFLTKVTFFLKFLPTAQLSPLHGRVLSFLQTRNLPQDPIPKFFSRCSG